MSVAAPVSSRLPRPGDMIAGKYVLERLLGQGGMGAVFAATHIKLSKAVAIKIMLADASNPEAAQRFINEGRAAANIQNEHVGRVDDVDEEMGYAYMVLELLDGEDLSQVLEREPTRRLAPHVVVGYVLEALKGVMQAHAIGIVHRDLKPSNLFLAKRKDGSVVVKVLDFGISKAQGSSALAASPSALTSTKAMLGSPLYMSPEQLRSSKSVDHRADIWAIGVILYELTTGQLPFLGDSLGELFANILETDPAPLRNHVPDVAPGLEQVVLRCLQRRPEQRFQSAAELIQALTPFASAQPGIGASAPLGGTALLPPGAAGPIPNMNAITPGHSVGAITPGTPSGMVRPPLPSHGASTGSGPRVIGGTVALGAVTPQGMQQTGGGWQSTGGTTGGAIPKSKAALLIAGAVAAVLLALGGIGAVLIAKSRPHDDPGTSDGVVVSAPPPPSVIPSTPPPQPTAAETAQPATTTSVASAEPPAPPPAPTPTQTSAATKSPKAPVPTAHAKVDPPKAPDPTPKATSTPKPNNGNLQNAR